MMRFEGIRTARIIARSLRNNPEDWTRHGYGSIEHDQWGIRILFLPPNATTSLANPKNHPVAVTVSSRRRWLMHIQIPTQAPYSKAVWLGLVARWIIKRAVKRFWIMRLRETVTG